MWRGAHKPWGPCVQRAEVQPWGLAVLCSGLGPQWGAGEWQPTRQERQECEGPDARGQRRRGRCWRSGHPPKRIPHFPNNQTTATSESHDSVSSDPDHQIITCQHPVHSVWHHTPSSKSELVTDERALMHFPAAILKWRSSLMHRLAMLPATVLATVSDT